MKRYVFYFQAVAGLIILATSCMSTKPYSVNQDEYLGVRTNPVAIYTNRESGYFYSPLNINISSMEKLMLVDFKGDSVYKTIELQTFNDSRGKGAVVILYGIHGDNDVFFTDSAFADHKLFEGHLYENKNIAYSIKVTDCGLDGYVVLQDKYGRNIEVRIKETSNSDAQTSFLAPVGGMIGTFTFFPLFYIEHLDFVKRAGTKLSVRIDDISLKPLKLPVFINGTLVYLSRYATKPVICMINDSYNGELKPLTPENRNSLTVGNITYELNNNNNHFEINKIICSSSNGIASISFSPAIPDLMNLAEGVKILGKFSMATDSITGIVAGTYQINRTGDKLTMIMNPMEAYSPMSGPLWVLSYEWKADIAINSDGSVSIAAKWNNNEK